MSKPITGDRIIDPNDQPTINRILQTIRNKESHSNYTAVNKGDGVTTNQATGAYQYLNSTWKGWAAKYSVAASYPTAAQAPPHIQDFIAEINVRAILASHSNHLAAVPIVWYYPKAWDNDAILDSIPAKSQGNTQTVRQYAEAWIKSYDGTSAGGANSDVSQVVPDSNSPMSVFDTVEYGLTHPWNGLLALATSPLDAIKAIGEMLSAAGRFLTNPDTWIRVLQVIGGTFLVGMGLWIATHSSDNMVPSGGLVSAAALA